ncbi:branched-chain amino acid ABC transporter permease [Bacillus horti]
MKKRGSKFYWSMILLSFVFYVVTQILISTGIINPFYTNLLHLIGINVMFAISLHLIIGITGQFSIGHAGFISIGAYASAIITMKLGLPFPLALLVAGIAAALAGLLIGIPTLRLKGDYLAIATLGFGEIVRIVFLNIDYIGGAAGMRVSHMTNWTWVFLLAFFTIIIIINFTNSTHGRACIATRDNEVAADAMGINTTLYKVIAFVLGAFLAGIAGALFAHNNYFIQPGNFGFLRSIEILIFVVIGGLGSLSGSIIAAALLTIINLFLQEYPETRMILYSLILLVIMLYRPKGLMGNVELSQLLGKKRLRTKGGSS